MCVLQFDTWSIRGVLVADVRDVASLTKSRAACALVAVARIAILMEGVCRATPLNAPQPIRIDIAAKAPAT
jgi:hypothetical protein